VAQLANFLVDIDDSRELGELEITLRYNEPEEIRYAKENERGSKTADGS